MGTKPEYLALDSPGSGSVLGGRLWTFEVCGCGGRVVREWVVFVGLVNLLETSSKSVLTTP